MKRIGDPSEKPFEKVPRRGEEQGDAEGSVELEEIEEIIADIPNNEFRFLTAEENLSLDIAKKLAENEATAIGEDDFAYDKLMKARVTCDPFGVFCVFALKEVGLDLDVISLIAPPIHLHSLWRLELSTLQKLQRKRLTEQRDGDKSLGQEHFLESEVKERIFAEASSIHLMSHFLELFGFNCDYLPQFLPLLLNNFRPDTPFVHSIFNAAGWSLAQVFIKGRHACEDEADTKKLDKELISNLLASVPLTLASIFMCCQRLDMDTLFLYLVADVVQNLAQFGSAMRDAEVMAMEEILKLVGGADMFDNVMKFFGAFREVVEEAQEEADLTQVISCISAMSDFLHKDHFAIRNADNFAYYCEIGYSILLTDCQVKQMVDVELVHALATAFRQILPYYISIGQRDMITNVVEFVLIVLPVDDLDAAKLSLIELLVEILRSERNYPDLFMIEEVFQEGRFIAASEYIGNYDEFSVKETLQKWILDPETEVLSMQEEMRQLVNALTELMAQNLEMAAQRAKEKKAKEQ